MKADVLPLVSFSLLQTTESMELKRLALAINTKREVCLGLNKGQRLRQTELTALRHVSNLTGTIAIAFVQNLRVTPPQQGLFATLVHLPLEM